MSRTVPQLFLFMGFTLLQVPSLLAKGAEPLHCEVAIVGGGAGGLHTAFRLGPVLGDKVCLFEKEKELGGRIHDISYDASAPDAPRIGAGARRVMEGQNVVLSLAQELGLQLETPTLGTDLIHARGLSSFSKDDFASLYPGMPLKDGDTDQETFLYDRLRFGPERQNAGLYPNFRNYVSSQVSRAGLDYLHDMTRFRADFEYPLDARSYLDYLDEEWDVCCTPSYPVGGMSSFIRGMEARAKASGVRIFTGEAVSRLARAKDGSYEIKSAHYNVSAAKLVIAVPPVAFKYIKGDVAQRIASQKAFQDIIEVKVATITQWWPYAWWKDIRNPKGEGEAAQVWRAWTTDSCINFIEIPVEPYAAAQNVTRSVYDDDMRCVNHWEKLSKESMPKVEAEIHAGLTQLLSKNGVTQPADVKIPKPLKTQVQIWPAAWHYLRAGATHTNAEIAAWAVEPLPGEPVALVGESYFPNRSGWSDGAYKSSIRLLNERYGMQLKAE